MFAKEFIISDFNLIKDTSLYMKNPLILYNHNFNILPIGKVIEIFGDKCKAKIIHKPPTGMKVKLWKKLIHAEEFLYPGYDSKYNLLELSIVTWGQK
jgi:hypothetical protein